MQFDNITSYAYKHMPIVAFKSTAILNLEKLYEREIEK